MKIYLLDLNNFNIEKLKDFSKISEFKNLKETQHYAGLYVVNHVCEKIYNLKNPQIIYENNKPFIENSNIFISISHCENYVIVGFNDNNIGVDIEYNNPNRDFIKVLDRYKEELWLKNLEIFKFLPKYEQVKLFYDFWTIHEAQIKLGEVNQEIFTSILDDIKDFTIGVAGVKELENIEIITAENMLRDALNNSVSRIKSVTDSLTVSVEDVENEVNNNAESVEHINVAIEEVAKTSQEVSLDAQNMMQQTQYLTASIDELSENIVVLNDSSKAIVSSNNAANEQVNHVMESSKEAILAVEEITTQIAVTNDAINEISKCLGIIEDITSQTNLLSLNASIEAARAGEAGKGFAVVAEEIRSLSDSTSVNSQEIKNIIQKVEALSAETVKTAEKVSKITNEEQTYITDTQDKFEILSSEVARSIDQINNIRANLLGDGYKRVNIETYVLEDYKLLDDQAEPVVSFTAEDLVNIYGQVNPNNLDEPVLNTDGTLSYATFTNIEPTEGFMYLFKSKRQMAPIFMAIYRTENSGAIEVFTDSVNTSAKGGSNIGKGYTKDGEWHYLIIDLEKEISSFDGISASYLRLDIINGSAAGQVVDLAYVGIFTSVESAEIYAVALLGE